jgi:CRP/FNR family cyclic AMP-dependent transcriptional regulator
VEVGVAVPVQVLKESALFAGFTDTGLTILAQIARMRDVPTGMSLFLEGAPGDAMYILSAGDLDIIAGQGDEARVLCALDPGEHFGELALLRAGKRSVTARARSACRVVEIRRAEFGDLLKQKPQACMKLMLAIMSTIERRVGALRQDLLSMG